MLSWLPCAFPSTPIFLLPICKFLGDGPCLTLLCTPQYLVQCWHILGMALRQCFLVNPLIFVNWFHPSFSRVCLANYNEMQILVRDSQCVIACLVKVASLRHDSSWWKNSLSLFSGCWQNKKADPRDSFPKSGISTLMRGERRPPQMDTCSSRHNLKTFIWNKSCQSVFLNDKTGKTIFSSEEDLPLVSKSPSGHWTHPLRSAYVTEKSQNFPAERESPTSYRRGVRKESMWI